MAWIDEARSELARGRQHEGSGNMGKVRTCGRRAAGIALREYRQRAGQTEASNDFIQLLRDAAVDDSIPVTVREAADRLQTRLDANFASPSQDPLQDAEAIIAFVISQS